MVVRSGDLGDGDEASSSSEELIESIGARARAGADLRREASDEVLGFEAGRGGLKAGALRLTEGLEDSDMVQSRSAAEKVS